MTMLHQNSLENAAAAAARGTAGKRRRPVSVHSCNFRTAGRLSNEDARAMTELHETIGQHVASELESHLGTSVEIKLETLDQLTIKEHVAEISPRCLVVPYAGAAFFVELDNELVYPIVDLLLGGLGDSKPADRDLSEIEEEIMQDVVLLIARQCRSVWQLPEEALTVEQRIKPAAMQAAFSTSEKATVLRYSVQCAGNTSSFRIVLTTEFLNLLLKQVKQDVPQKKQRVFTLSMPPLRERILDCDTAVTAELMGLRVSVRDLVGLQAGSLLKLRAPIRNPAVLTAGGHALFEAQPVRNGSQRAAQLMRRARNTDWGQGR